MKTKDIFGFTGLGGMVLQTNIRIFLFLMVLTASAIAGSMVYGETLSVPESAPSIKEAMDLAKAGDIILVSCGTYFEHDILVKSGVSLWSGTLQASCVTIDAQGKGRGLIFSNADSSTSIVGFTVTGGVAHPEDLLGQGGGILFVKSQPKISNCVVIGNHAETGGGFFADQGSTLNFSNCRIEKNTATFMGGGGAFAGDNGLVTGCQFLENIALSGGGLFLQKASSVQVNESYFGNNSAGNCGGGVLLIGSECTMEGTVFSDNVGGLGGGGIASISSTSELVRCTLYGNQSESEGSALGCGDSQMKIINSQLTFHPCPLLYQENSSVLLSGCNLYGNSGGDWEGALADQIYKRHNISENPLFCQPESGDFRLSSNSACLPINNPAGNKSIIGAFGVGCTMVAENEAQSQQLAKSSY